MTNMPLVLGSASPWRKSILKQHGYHFIVHPANIDEKAIRHENPKQLVTLLAQAKADAIKDHYPDQIIITCDQVVFCQNEIREKPESKEQAKRFLKSYGKHPAWTYSSVCVTQGNRQCYHVDIAKIICHPIPNECIDLLIEEGEVLRCAGGFQIESQSHPDQMSPYVKAIEGDPYSVRGIAPTTLDSLLKQLNIHEKN